MLMDSAHKQSESASSFPNGAANLSPDSAALFFPANFLEPTTPETFLELDPAGFFTHSSSSAAKGSCASAFTQETTPINWPKLEPSREPCTGEIPWPDLVFWLGNTLTGEVSCSCAQCSQRAMRNAGLLRQHRYSPYQQQQQQQQQQRRRVSSRVPVINLPRIEGVN